MPAGDPDLSRVAMQIWRKACVRARHDAGKYQHRGDGLRYQQLRGEQSLIRRCVQREPMASDSIDA